MKKIVIPLLLVVIIGLSGLFVARFLFGGDEDTWICQNNQWVKHGNPNAPIPQSGCGDTVSNLKTQMVEEIGLTLSYPNDLTFRKELGDDYGKLRTLAFYIEKGDQNNPEYQLYALFLADKEATQTDLEKAKMEMDKNTIKDTSIAGYKGIEGLIVGPKTRYITTVIKDGRLFSVSTIPPTEENKAITDRILSTFSFK